MLGYARAGAVEAPCWLDRRLGGKDMRGKTQVLISAVSLVWCGISQAQQVSSGADSDVSPGLTEIVVTAERRSTDLQRTAIAATVLSGSELQEKGINTVEDLQF